MFTNSRLIYGFLISIWLGISSITGIDVKLKFLPKEWSSYRIVKSASILNDMENGGYLVQEMFHSYTCEGTPERTEATKLGACIGGLDESGASMGSWFASYNATTPTQQVQISHKLYSSPDCTGKVSYSYLETMSSSCDYGMMNLYIDTKANPTPWYGWNDGIIVHNYADTTSCPSNPHADDFVGGDIWQNVAFNYCLGVGNNALNGAQSMQYIACADDEVKAYYYTDCCCQSLLEAVSFVEVCATCPGSSSDSSSGYCYPQGFEYITKETIQCNKQ